MQCRRVTVCFEVCESVILMALAVLEMCYLQRAKVNLHGKYTLCFFVAVAF